ncbi:MAG: hypothetical protein FWD38_05580 [Oscillospiraceae bacterium]|nr:hypothetical protein [Oscillospiraceae bacterium]
MDISFIFTADEIFTLASMINNHSPAGKEFIGNALTDAQICDLSSLAEKEHAQINGDKLELEPVIRMVFDTVTKAVRVVNVDDYWMIYSNRLTLKCEKYRFKENSWKISPIKGAAEQ